jgi:multicomponent Na+:H+ antiporter subunit D
MPPNAWLPIAIVLSSLVPAVAILFLREESHRLRTTLNLAGAALKLALMGMMAWGVFHGRAYEARLPVLPSAELVLHADGLSVLFASLSTVLWLVTTVYAVGYLEGAPHRSRFFAFFNLCVSATMGVALAGNLLTFLVFYEILTLAAFPLVVHRGTEAAHRGGRTYLAHALPGGIAVLVGVAWLAALGESREFVPGGFLSAAASEHRGQLTAIFALLVGGFGVKAGLVPLHRWLPAAMVAPAPVSALLHAVAVVKAGAFGIVRVVYEVYGAGLASRLGVLAPLAAWAAVTIIYGSVRALAQGDLKRRLAYSTVSQVSVITLGAAIAGPVAAVGGLVHLVHQGVMKITLFFCAGNFAEALGIHRIADLRGVGRRMPLTAAAFTIAALGMIGVPPLAGFVTKWYLSLGGIAAGEPWVLWVLAASTLLNAAYFLPIVVSIWLGGPAEEPAVEHHRPRLEAHWMLLVPTLVTGLLVVLAGLVASAPVSPLEWTRAIAAREFGL